MIEQWSGKAVLRALGALVLSCAFASGYAFSVVGKVRLADLPEEARETIALIRAGGAFPYAKDGSVFGNREGALPRRERGYYREYTVRTPGSRDRGARRIVAGGGNAQFPREYYYTDDHYRTFRRVVE